MQFLFNRGIPFQLGNDMQNFLFRRCVFYCLCAPFFLFRYLDDQTSILLFTSLKESDGGNYTCVASNEVSKDAFSSFLLVKGNPLGFSCISSFFYVYYTSFIQWLRRGWKNLVTSQWSWGRMLRSPVMLSDPRK